VDLTNDDIENIPPMVLGGPCGHLSSASNIPYLVTKMRNVTLTYGVDDLPEDLKDVNAPGWKDGQELLATFKLPAGSLRDGKQ
jgi:hypothetical protein